MTEGHVAQLRVPSGFVPGALRVSITVNLKLGNSVHLATSSECEYTLMREDMAKVIVERPRKKGHSYHKPKGYQRQLHRCGDDNLPGREGIKSRWKGRTKYLNEHLGPLRRYLTSQVGQPWNKVFSDICAHINRGSAVQDHVRDHVDQYVMRNVLLVDGVPCCGEGGWSYGKPLRDMPWKPWYVCPETGLLCQVKAVSRKRRRPPKGEARPTCVRVSETLQCRWIDKAWHLVTLEPLATAAREEGRDVVLNRRLTAVEARQEYGAEVYAVARRRLGRKELRQYPIPRRWWRA